MTPNLRQLWAGLVSAGIEHQAFSALTEEGVTALCDVVVRACMGPRLEEIDRHLKRIAENPAHLQSVEACHVRALGRFKEELESVKIVMTCEKQGEE